MKKILSAAGSRGRHGFTLQVVEQQITHNGTSIVSIVNATATLEPITTGYAWDTPNNPPQYQITIGNQIVPGTLPYYSGQGTVQFFQETFVILHENAGNFSIPCKFQLTDPSQYGPGDVYMNDTYPLTSYQYQINNNNEVTLRGFTQYNSEALASEHGVIFPNKIENYPVVRIDDYAFQYAAIANIVIPDSITSIGLAAFSNTAWYTNQPNGIVYAGKVAYTYKGTIPNNTVLKLRGDTLGIADDAFNDYSTRANIIAVELPIGLKTIGTEAFSGTSIKNISIPNTVTKIGSYAFASSSNLTKVALPSFVEVDSHESSGYKLIADLGYGIFTSCYNIDAVYYADIKIAWDAMFAGPPNYSPHSSCFDFYYYYDGHNYTVPVIYCFDTSSTFTGMHWIGINGGPGLIDTGNSCFRNDHTGTPFELLDDYQVLNKKDIEPILGTADPGQNVDFSELNTQSKNIIGAINEVNQIANESRSAVTYNTYDEMKTALNTASQAEFPIGKNIYILSTNVPDLWITNISSPAVVYTGDITAFNTALTNNQTVKLGYYTVAELKNSVVDLSDYYNKGDSDNRYVQKVTGKGLSTNDYTDAAKNTVAISVGNTFFNYFTTDNSSGILFISGRKTGITTNNIPSHLVIPDTGPTGFPVMGIYTSCFEGCTTITSIVLPESLTYIGPHAFYGCTGITQILIPDKVKNILGNAFYNCTNLNKIILSNSIQAVGEDCFANIDDYAKIYYLGTPEEFSAIEGIQSAGFPNNVTIYFSYPHVDQTFDADSTNAQSGVAIAAQLNGKQKIISSGTEAPSGGSNGDIYLKYE